MFNKTLPIYARRDEIVQAVREHDVVVITAETGAGKSTQVPQFLLEDWDRVVVTQPRRLAARTVAERVAEEVCTPLGEIVGFRTAHERKDSQETRVLFCTDGLQLVRELTGSGAQVLVIDEVHEWNLNIETLVAWAKRKLADGANFKVVLMSATIEAERLAEYFGNCPVISVEGRTYPVSMLPDVEKTPAQRAAIEAFWGRNVLVFASGKAEIDAIMSDIDAEVRVFAHKYILEGKQPPIVLPLHGELTADEQRKVFQHFDRPKIVVSTNVAQTSVTIDDIDVVVDGGIERRTEVRDGVEGLYLGDISQADCHQRAGRAGRTKRGTYYLCSRVLLDLRPEFPTAVIERSRLDQLVLRLAMAGLDATTLEFFHQPDRNTLIESKAALVRLGALYDNGKVSKTGRAMSQLPVDVHLARMVVEAMERHVIDAVLTIAACLEAGGIRDRTGAWRALTEERESDLLAELDCYDAARELHSGKELREAGIFAKAFYRAKEIRSHLSRALRGKVEFGQDVDNRVQVLKACVAGMVDHLYRNEWGQLRNGGGYRELARESVVNRNAEWITGMPFDLEVKARGGGTFTLHLVQFATAVDPAWLAEVAPQLVSTVIRNYRYNPEQEMVVVDQVTIFNGQETTTTVIEAQQCAEATTALVLAMMQGQTGHPAEAHNAEVRVTLSDLHTRSGGKVQPLSDQQLQAFYAERVGESKSLAEIAEFSLRLNLDTYAPAALREEIDRLYPRTITLLGSELAVVYRTGYIPKVALPREVAVSFWKGLPDEGVKLPGGQAVEIELSLELYAYSTYHSANIPQLKVQVREHLNRRQWENWRDRPQIALPAADGATVEVPPIVEATYGADAMNGEPLMAYGTVALNRDRYYTYDPFFKVEWHQERDQAEAARTSVASKIHEFKEAAIAQLRLAQVKEQAETLRHEVERLRREHYYDLPNLLGNRLYTDGCRLPMTSDVARLEAWAANTKALVAEVRAAVAKVGQTRQEAKLLQSQAQQLLGEHGDSLDDEEYDLLADAANNSLPTTVEGLEEWMSQSRALIVKVEDILTRPNGGGWRSEDEASTALADLAARFNRR